MFDQYLRALKDRLLNPVARALGPGLSPDVITFLAFAVGLASAAAILWGRIGLALGLWLLNRVLDGLDGTHARVHARESEFGAYIDIVLDFAVYAAIPGAIVAAGRAPELAVAGVLLLASFYVNAASWMYLAAILAKRREGTVGRGGATTVTMPSGLVAGTETGVFYTLFLLLPSHQVSLFLLMALLVLANVVWRLYWAKQYL